MPIGGKLVLKGGMSLKGGVKKKRKKAKDKKTKDAGTTKEEKDQVAVKGVDPLSVSVQSGKTYEEEFDIETQRAQVGQGRRTPWGTAFAKPPKILHGYDREIEGDTAEKRLDIRCAQRTDKFCK